jgi:hypothetical protein
MKEAAEMAERIKKSAVDLEQLKRDCVTAGINPMDALDLEEAATILEHLVARITREPR